MKQRLLFIISFLLFFYGNAQTVSTQGKEFYITFPKIDIAPESSERWGIQTIQLQITSLVNTSGTITNPGNGYIQPFTITAGTATTLIVPRPQCMNSAYETINAKGLIVTTADTSSVYAMSVQNYTSDASNILPVNALGTDYIVSSYYSTYTSISSSEFAIVATTDNTDIQITPAVTTTGGKVAGQVFNITLNKGQSYNVASLTGDITGSLITVTNGCKPIAVFSGNDVGYIPDTYGTGDYLYEQLFPLNTLGKNFIVANLKSHNSSKVKITAPYNNTSININGSIAATINKGQHYEFEITAPLTGSTFRPGGDVFDLITDASNNLYATGNYTNADGYFYVSKWDGTTWKELAGSGAGALNATANIGGITSDNNGNIYIAVAYSGTASNGYIAKWDGTTWTKLGALNTNGYIVSVAVDAAGNVYAAGDFTNANGYKYVSKWNGTTWTELGTGTAALNANGMIRSITTDAAGNIYATGYFTNSSAYCYVAKWDGTAWTGLGVPYFFAIRFMGALKSDAAGNVYVQSYLNGQGHVNKWDGTTWTDLMGGENPSLDLTLDPMGTPYAFGSADIIKWDGTAWVKVGIGVRGLTSMGSYSGTANVITADALGNVYTAGDFHNGVVWWNGSFWKDASRLFTPIPVAYSISTSNPVQVMEYATGKYYDETKGPENGGDPTMLTIAPLEQTTTNTVFALPDIGAIINHYITITTKTTDTAKTMLDGINIGQKFTVIPANPFYSIAQLDAIAGTHHLLNSGGLIASAYGFGPSQGYGYNIGSMANKINISFKLLNGCTRQKIFNIETADIINTYTWNFGDGSPPVTTNGFVIQQIHNYALDGNYTVTLTGIKSPANDCPEINTITSTSTVAVVTPAAPTILAEAGASLCTQNSIRLNAGMGFTDYLWSTGDRSANININDFGNYTVTVTDTMGCQSADTINIKNDCPCKINIPAIFTPNNDGYYDTWKIGSGNCVAKLNVSVYSRWGGLVYHADNYQNDWNGVHNSLPLPDATYYYVITAFHPDGHTQLLKGNVTIMR